MEKPYFIMWPREFQGVGYCFWQYREEPDELRLNRHGGNYQRMLKIRNPWPDQRGQFRENFIPPPGWRRNEDVIAAERAFGRRKIPREELQRMTLIVSLLNVPETIAGSSSIP